MKKVLLYTLILFAVACKSKYRKAADEIFDATDGNTSNMNVGRQNYILDIPQGWKTANTTYRGINYYFLYAPKTKDDPNTCINVITEYMQNVSLDVFKVKTIESIKKAIPSAIILAQGDIYANGLKGGWYSYTMEQQGIKSSLICYIFPKNGVAYSITGGTQQKDAARYRNTFDAVARSFRFYNDRH